MRTALSLAVGLVGLVLLLCEADNTTALLLSKIIALALLTLAAYGLMKADEHGELNKLKRFFDNEE